MKIGIKPKRDYATGAASKPIMPDYLSAEAQDVWIEELERVVAIGVNADQSSTFASSCRLEAACRAFCAVRLDRRQLNFLHDNISSDGGAIRDAFNALKNDSLEFLAFHKAGR